MSPASFSCFHFSSPMFVGAGFSSLETWSCARTFSLLNVIACVLWDLPPWCLVTIPVVDWTAGWKFDSSAPLGYELQLFGSSGWCLCGHEYLCSGNELLHCLLQDWILLLWWWWLYLLLLNVIHPWSTIVVVTTPS